MQSDLFISKRNVRLAIRIMQARMDLSRGKSSLVETVLRQGLEEDMRDLDPAPLSAEEHRCWVNLLLLKAAQLGRRDDEHALELYRQCVTHAYWAGDVPLAERCYRAYKHLSVLMNRN